MKLKSLAIMAALAAMPAPFVVQARDKAPPPVLSADDSAAIARAEARGRLMYAYDQAAWHGTDDLKVKLTDFATRVEGWVVDGPAEAPQLVFYSRDKDNPKAIYVASFRGTKLVSSKVLGASDDTSLTPARLKLIDARRRARDALIQAKVGFCANASPNSIVLPPETPGGPYLVYFMTPQTKAGSLPFGGHYLFEIAADGIVSGPRRFTRSCLELPTTIPPGAAALGVSHLLDPVPTEIHVFSQISAGVPVMVIIPQPKQRLFMIKKGRIEAMPDQKPL